MSKRVSGLEHVDSLSQKSFEDLRPSLLKNARGFRNLLRMFDDIEGMDQDQLLDYVFGLCEGEKGCEDD